MNEHRLEYTGAIHPEVDVQAARPHTAGTARPAPASNQSAMDRYRSLPPRPLSAKAFSPKPVTRSIIPQPKMQLERPGTAPPLQGRKGIPRTKTESVTGSHYQFYLTGVHGKKESRHMDVTFDTFSSWDKDDADFDTSERSQNVGYSRMYYTWSARKKAPTAAVQMEETTFRHFQSEKSVAMEEFNAWAGSLRPRSVHDYKPLLVLVQGVLRCLLEGEFQWCSSQVMALKQQLAEAVQMMALLERENHELQDRLKRAGTDSLVGSFVSKLDAARQRAKHQMELAAKLSETEQQVLDNEEASREKHRAELLQLAQAKDAEIERLKKALQERSGEVKGLKEKLSMANAQIEDLQRERRGPSKAHAAAQTEADDSALQVLFGCDGAWQFVSNLEEMRNIILMALEHMWVRFGVRVEVTRMEYDKELDMDGEDDPETYDDNVLEVVMSLPGGREPLSYVPRSEADHLYRAANFRMKVVRGDVVAMPVLMEKEHGHRLGEVWGLLEGSGNVGELGQHAMQLFAQGMGYIVTRLDRQESARLRSMVQQVADVVTNMRWAKTEAFKNAAREVIDKAQLKNELDGDSDNLANLARKRLRERQARMLSLLEDPEARRKSREMEMLRTFHERLVELQRARTAIDAALHDEYMRNMLSQIKSYRNPPMTVVKIMLGLFTTLGHTEVWRVCKVDDGNPPVRMVSEETSQTVWRIMHQRMDVNLLLKAMRMFEPGVNLEDGLHVEHETVGTVQVNITHERNRTVARILESIEKSEATHASMAAGMVQEWVRVMHRMTECLEKQAEFQRKLGVETVEHGTFVSAEARDMRIHQANQREKGKAFERRKSKAMVASASTGYHRFGDPL